MPHGQQRKKEAKSDVTDRRLARLLEYLQHHFTEQITVEALAREAAISPFYFARLFRAKVGISPAQYIVGMRLTRARKRLKETDMAVCDVAYACGYAHAGHFAAAFSKQFGLTPLTYRLTR